MSTVAHIFAGKLAGGIELCLGACLGTVIREGFDSIVSSVFDITNLRGALDIHRELE
jgi:hypothetical protein